jgi:anti-anti-sigma factor
VEARDQPDIEIEPSALPAFEAIVVLRAEHDLQTVPRIEATLAQLSGSVLVDLSACEFMDSTVIAALLRGSQARLSDGARLALVVPPANENVSRVVDIVGLRAALDVYDSRLLAG